MPSSQMQVASTNIPASGAMSCKPPPPPNKLPPAPPPLPPPRPPPPPPPRNSSQLLCQSSAAQLSNQNCAGANAGIPQNVSGMLQSGSSVGSLNTAGRCGHSQSIIPNSNPSQHCQRNLMKFNDNCSSRSSISSHSSLQHHHHSNINHQLPNSTNGTTGLSNMCSHQANNICPCQTPLVQHNHVNSSSMSESGSCSGYGLDNRGVGSSNCTGCCGSNNVHHVHNMNPKYQQSQVALNMTANMARGNNGSGGPISTTISRNTLFHADNSNSNNESRVHCQGSCTHHHHHHHGLHENQVATNTSMSPLQPVDGSFHRCHAAQSNTISSLPSLMSDQRSSSMNSHCNHAHRANICNHHHQATNFCDHHVYSTNQQLTPHPFNVCLHSHHGCASPNAMTAKGYNASCNSNRHCPQGSTHANRSSDVSNNDSLLSTTHTHNLSNSSTTTHTSNVAVKHQPQSFVHPALSRGNRSNSSQNYDQYGQSSAASTSSATASLSNYQAGSEDFTPLYRSKIHQPLPPPPARMTNINNNTSINNNGNMNHASNIHEQVMTTLFNTSQGPQSMHPLPPLPPKPHSPNASSCSTQITTVTSSPSLLNQPITRVTSQAGVQNQLPERNTPPPLPPLNPGSRAQPQMNSPFTRGQQQLSSPTMSNQQLVNFNPPNRNDGQMTDAERKTEALTKEVELELERLRKTGEPHGICFKCGEKVMPAQEACKAMNKIYHASCFVCCVCNRTLLSKTFYPVLDKVYCEEDFKVNQRSMCQ